MRLFFMSLVVGFAGHLAAKEVATIGDEKLSESDFRTAVESLGPQAKMIKGNPQVRVQFLNHLIDTKLMAKEAETKYPQMVASEDFKARLAMARDQILSQMYIDKYLESETSDKKVKSYFEDNKKLFTKEEVRASHILIKEQDKELADKVLAEAKKSGADFAALAKKHSTGPSGPNGGDLNYFSRGRMVPEFEAAAFETAKGFKQGSGGLVHPNLVKTQFGYHIIKVTDFKGGSDPKFADNKEEAKTRLTRQIQESIRNDLRAKANVKINDGVLQSMKL